MMFTIWWYEAGLPANEIILARWMSKLLSSVPLVLDNLFTLFVLHENSAIQIVDVCEEYQKEDKLARLLDEIGSEQGAKILVFTETKRKCDELTR